MQVVSRQAYLQCSFLCICIIADGLPCTCHNNKKKKLNKTKNYVFIAFLNNIINYLETWSTPQTLLHVCSLVPVIKQSMQDAINNHTVYTLILHWCI